jgi:hypothetical protein
MSGLISDGRFSLTLTSPAGRGKSRWRLVALRMAIQSGPSQVMIETEHNSPSPSGRGRGEGEDNVNSGFSEIELRPCKTPPRFVICYRAGFRIHIPAVSA